MGEGIRVSAKAWQKKHGMKRKKNQEYRKETSMSYPEGDHGEDHEQLLYFSEIPELERQAAWHDLPAAPNSAMIPRNTACSRQLSST